MNAAASLVHAELAPEKTAAEICAETLAHHSKSFALAGKLLPTQARRDAAVLYTYCRLADDSIDLVAPEAQPAALAELQASLAAIYRGEPQLDVRLRAFQELVQRVGIPREYPDELLAGMSMDTTAVQYQTLEELLLYCHRVAGVVGLMMCHVLGVSEARALRNAAHLGIGMQLTNICRDVAEDFQRGRLYLPLRLLGEAGLRELRGAGPGTLPRSAQAAISRVTRHLLAEADRFYRSGERGLPKLPWRAAFAVRAAGLIYQAIGGRILGRGYDPYLMRAIVPQRQKQFLVLKAALFSLAELPRRFLRSGAPARLGSVVRFPDDILPV